MVEVDQPLKGGTYDPDCDAVMTNAELMLITVPTADASSRAGKNA